MGLADFLSGGFSTSSSASSSSPFANNAGITFGDSGGIDGLSSNATASASADRAQTPVPGTAGQNVATVPSTLGSSGINSTYLLIGAAVIVAIFILKKKSHV